MGEDAVQTGDSAFDYWVEAFEHRKNGNIEECKKVLTTKCIPNEFQAITDNPGANFFLELHQLFPEALVILSIRDSTEEWVQSYLNSGYLMHQTFLNKIYRKIIHLLPFPSNYT